MTLDWLLWSIPAVFTQFFLRQARQKNFITRSLSTWEYVFELVPLSVFSFALSGFGLAVISKLVCPPQYEMFRAEWVAFCSYPYSFRIVLSSALSPLTAKLVGIALGVAGRIFSSRNTDPNILTKGDLVFATLKSRKVYVGMLLGKVERDHLGMDIINLVPIMSGHRDEKHNVIYNTKYPAVLSEDRKFIIHIATSEVATIARFDHDIHKEFVRQKRTRTRFPRSPNPA